MKSVPEKVFVVNGTTALAPTSAPRSRDLTTTMMRLAVTGHFVRTGRVGGAEPMLYNLLDGFAAEQVETTLLCGSTANLAAGFLAAVDPATLRIIEGGGSGNRFVAEQRVCLDRGLAADAVLFPNYYVPPVVPRRLGRVAVVMHDFQYRHFPQYFSAKKRAWLRASQTWAMRRADCVIAISQFVRADAVRWFGRGIAGKLTVVPNPISWDRFATGLALPRPLARPYILSVAAQYPHKNLETLVRAFGMLARSNDDVQLILCGQSYDGLRGVADRRAGLGALIAELGLSERVRLTGYVDDAALAQWYRHAEMFAFPSLFEGFGMPPTEALGFGLPTLVSNTTALPEVTLGLAQTVQDPLDVCAWADAMAEILRSPGRYRPCESEIARLRAFYHPARIARAYVAALAG